VTVSEANKRIVRFVREEAMRRGQLDKLDGLYSREYVYHGVAMLGDLRGLTAFKDLASGFVAAVSDFEERVEDQVAEGNKVATRLTGRGRHTGELMGQAPTGKEIRWTAIILTRFADGKIAEEWSEFDALGLSQQLGASR